MICKKSPKEFIVEYKQKGYLSKMNQCYISVNEAVQHLNQKKTMPGYTNTTWLVTLLHWKTCEEQMVPLFVPSS